MSAVPAPKSVQQMQQTTNAPAYVPQQQHYNNNGAAVAPQVPSYGQQDQGAPMPSYHQHQGAYGGGYHNHHNHHQGSGYYHNNNNQGRQHHNNSNNNQNKNHHNNNNNNANNNNSKENTTGNATNCDPSTHAEVYAFNNVALYTIPHEDIISMPSLEDPSNSQIKNLQLCPNFDSKNPTASCDKGPACKFVHAKLDNAETHNIHVNYAWPNPEDVLYETFPAGDMLGVAPPNSNNPTDQIPSHLVLKTRALQSSRRVISHCAHYYFNRVCNRGSECYFIHAISLTPIVNEAGYIEDPTRRIWGRTQTKKNPPTNQSSQRQTPTPTPQVVKTSGGNGNLSASASGFQTPSAGFSNLSRQDSSVGRNAGFPSQPSNNHLVGTNAPPPPALSSMHAAFLNGGSTQDLTKLNSGSDNSDSDGVDAELEKSGKQNSGTGSKLGSKSNSALSSPFRRTHNPYSMTNPVVRSYNGSPVSPVPPTVAAM